ncbi:MAG: hypothetical protein LIQ31_11775 [Planctomycetes bacterium]|nr:hypothetical protein [Planctomycetota bacterium]
MTATLAGYDRESLWTALAAAIDLYRRFRDGRNDRVEFRREAENVAVRTMAELRDRSLG